MLGGRNKFSSGQDMRLKNWVKNKKKFFLTCLCEASFSHKNDPSHKQGNLKLFLLHYVSCMEKRSV